MRKFIVNIILTLLCFSSTVIYAQEKFTIDSQHSYVLWQIKHLGFSNQSGKWYANGTILLDKDHPQNSKVDVTIKIADVVTGIPKLDKHLKSKLFFDTATYPTATFVSKKVEVTGENTAKVEGILTLHGISKPVTLDVVLNQTGINPISEKMTVGFSAMTTIKRSDFGMNTLLPGLGDEVKLTIEAEAFKS